VLFITFLFIFVSEARLEASCAKRTTFVKGNALGRRTTKIGGGGAVDDHKMSGIELGACIMADLCPHGMLPLAWASVAGGGTGLVPCILLVTIFCAISTYTIYLAALVTETNKVSPPPKEFVSEQTSVEEESSSGGFEINLKIIQPARKSIIEIPKTASVALSSAWRSAGLPFGSGIDALVAALCGGCCIFYAAFATDLFYSLARQFFYSNLPRFSVILTLMAGPFIPLSLSDNLSALKYSSYAGLIGIIYTVLFIIFYGKPDSTLAQQRLRTVTSAKNPPNIGFFDISSGTAVLMNTLVVAFLCHYNAIQYYIELRNPRTLKKYGKITSIALCGTAIIFLAILFAGRNAFGHAALPNLLNNLPDNSIPAAIARLGTGVAIVSGFPLMFAGFKAALDAALPSLVPSDIKKEEVIQNLPSSFTSIIFEALPLRTTLHLVSLLFIGFAAAIATEEDIGLVIEIIGSTIGCAAAYIVPSIAAIATKSLPTFHRRAAFIIALTGSILSICSTYITLQHA